MRVFKRARHGKTSGFVWSAGQTVQSEQFSHCPKTPLGCKQPPSPHSSDHWPLRTQLCPARWRLHPVAATRTQQIAKVE